MTAENLKALSCEMCVTNCTSIYAIILLRLLTILNTEGREGEVNLNKTQTQIQSAEDTNQIKQWNPAFVIVEHLVESK